MRVGYLGPAGTHSEEALRAAAPEGSEAIPFPTVHDTVMAVREGTVARALVPIENALEGGVAATLDALALDAPEVRIVGEAIHPIHHCLVAGRQLDLDEITRVISHPQATAQCARFLRARLPGVEWVAAPSTADAVQSVRDAGKPVAALGSRLAAELYGCVLLAENVEDHPDNATRFVWLGLGEQPPGPIENAKTSIVFWGGGDRRPGWLVAVMGELATRGVNLTRIESRPRRLGLGHYMFFVDLEGSMHTASVREALDGVRGQVEELRVLGSYPSAAGAPG